MRDDDPEAWNDKPCGDPRFRRDPISIFLDPLPTAIYELADEVEFDEENDVDEPCIE